tara:strand:+ start:5194 stop:6246 length:1053 start_codon:yes stop_codon:yes gene_type:complete
MFYSFGLIRNKHKVTIIKNKELEIKQINSSYALSYTLNKSGLFFNIILIFFSLLYIFLCFVLLSLDRADKITFLTSNKFITTIASIGTFLFIIVCSNYVYNKSKINKFEKLFILSSVIFGFLEGGREMFVYILLVFLPYLRYSRNKFIPYLALLTGLIGLIIWKAISFWVIKSGDFHGLQDYLTTDFKFSITSMDPLGSLLLLNNYLDGSVFFVDYYFSYFVNSIKQVLGALGLIDYDSLSVASVKYFDYQFYLRGKGFAFSGILESILNFWYFGPAVLGFTIGNITTNLKKYFSSEFKIKVIQIFLVIILLKLVRTELAVVLKIYLLPMIISYTLFFKKIIYGSPKNNI